MNSTHRELSFELLAPCSCYRPEFPEHFGQQLHRQADDVRLAAFDNMDPAEAVLVAEGAGFAFPLAAGEVFVELLIGELVHAKLGDGDADEGGSGWLESTERCNLESCPAPP